VIAKRNALEMELQTPAQYPVTEPVPVQGSPDESGNGGIKGKRMSKKDKLRAAAAQASSPQAPTEGNSDV